MIDREKLVAVLRCRFTGATTEQVAAAANAIMGLDDEWEELAVSQPKVGYTFSVECGDVCTVARQVHSTSDIRVFRRRGVDGPDA